MQTYLIARRDWQYDELIDLSVEINGDGFDYHNFHCFVYEDIEDKGWYTCEESTGLAFGILTGSRNQYIFSCY